MGSVFVYSLSSRIFVYVYSLTKKICVYCIYPYIYRSVAYHIGLFPSFKFRIRTYRDTLYNTRNPFFCAYIFTFALHYVLKSFIFFKFLISPENRTLEL